MTAYRDNHTLMYTQTLLRTGSPHGNAASGTQTPTRRRRITQAGWPDRPSLYETIETWISTYAIVRAGCDARSC